MVRGYRRSPKMCQCYLKLYHTSLQCMVEQENKTHMQNPLLRPNCSTTVMSTACHINPLNYVIVIASKKPPDIENEITPILQSKKIEPNCISTPTTSTIK